MAKAAMSAKADMAPSTGNTASARSPRIVRQLTPASSNPCLIRDIQTPKESPHEHDVVALGLLMTNPRRMSVLV